MEKRGSTQVNSEFQKLADRVRELSEYGGSTSIKKQECESIAHSIEMLGTIPTLPENVEEFRKITHSMTQTYSAKNHDYGNSFDISLDKFGLVAAVVRIGDKMNRIESLISKEARVKDESIKDTLLDMANYAIMTVMWMNKNNKV